MDALAPPVLSHWQNFYVIVGSSAGALTGLQFVVIALIAQARAASNMQAIRVFGTPNIVQFCGALLISAVMTAPWLSLRSVALCITGCGIAGVIYGSLILLHARKRMDYEPEASDWLWFVVLPLAVYALLLVAGLLLCSDKPSSLFLIASISLSLLFIGVRNAWDTVTYIAVERYPREGGPDGD